MRFTHLSYLAIPALAMASPPVHAPAMPFDQFLAVRDAAAFKSEAMIAAASLTSFSTPSPTPTSSQGEQAKILELRQAAGNDNLGTTLDQATQAGTVTSEWVESTNSITTTWVEMVYTQTFASVVDQLTTAGAGNIGLGTITGTVGVVKEKSGAHSVMPHGTLITVAIGALGVITGMGMIVL